MMDWNQITAFIDPLLKPLEPDGLLWHYTDTRGLEGIVRNRTIRLSHPSFLNDPSELQYANSVYKEMLTMFANHQSPLAQKFASGYEDYRKDKYLHVPFVASFCKDYDNLELWRQYGDDGRGFSLGFRTEGLQSVLKRQTQQREILDIYIYKILYDKNDQDDLRNKILEFSLSYFKKIHKAGENPIKMYEQLSGMLEFFVPLFKHPCYANEQENRLVLPGHITHYYETKFLASRGYFKPYIDLKIEKDGVFPLDTIVVGPAIPLPRRSKLSLEMFLNNHGLGGDNNICILRSVLPYLGSDKGFS